MQGPARFIFGLLFCAWITSRVVVAGQAEAAFEPAFGPEAIDAAQCRQIVDGAESPAPQPQVLSMLALKNGPAWRPERVKEHKQAAYHYIVALSAAAPIGAIAISGPDGDGLISRSVAIAKPDVTAPKFDSEKDWDVLAPTAPGRASSLYTLPPGAKGRVFRVSEIRHGGSPSVESIRFYKKRLHSITQDATGIGERGPFCYHPSAVINGEHWQNAQVDPDPTSKATKILRPPVTDVAPSWFILHWDEPRALNGIFLRSNAAQYKIYAYTGDARINPALAGNDDWARVDYKIQYEETREHDKTPWASRWITFAPVKTQALKIHVLECAPKGAQVFAIATFQTLTDLGDAPVPPRRDPDSQAYHFAYSLAQPGDTALAIKSMDGRHIRTLYTQLEKNTGEQSEIWDLKDDQGRVVEPGSYRWEAINAPPIELHYQMCATPNVEMRSAERTPWHQEISGPHGWLADHAMATTCTTLGDKVYFGAPGVEGGTSFIECDLNAVKQWGKVNFGAWTGPQNLSADGTSVLIHAGNTIYRMNPATHDIKEVCPANAPERKGWVQSIAGHDGKVYVARSSPVPFIDNAVVDWQVDLEHCLPFYPKEIRGNYRTVPNPRVDFLRAVRLTGTPPGQQEPQNDKPSSLWPVFLDSTQGQGRRQFVMLAFKEPQAIGSLVFPHPGGKVNIKFSTLKPNAPYPPNAAREADWIPFEQNGKPGWECVAAPANTLTRALRISFVQPGDEIDDLMEGPGENPAAKPNKEGNAGDLFSANDDKKDDSGAKRGWFGRLEGLKILRRRLASLSPTAKVRVNSGAVADGVWDAKRTEAVTPQSPGIYLIEWDAAQNVCGLAIKEIDGAKTEIDVWTGAETGAIPLDGEEGWKKVATYNQPRRYYYEPDFNRNDCARYMDGYVNFDAAIKTRAVRLRVVEQWLDNGSHYPHGLRKDMGALTLDPRRCRIFGVAALTSIGGEAPLDTRVYQGLDIIDTQSGKLQETVNLDPGYSLAVNAAGEICTLRDYGIQKIDVKTGKTTPVVQGLKSPERLTTSADGNYYVYCGHDGGSVINVFDKDGKPVRVIGHSGGIQPGPWDPQRMSNVNALCVDKSGSLWVMDTDDQPRRTIQFKADGTFVQELLGNTHYGGGGTLNRYDLSRAYLGRVEFEIDWEKRSTKIRNILAPKIYGDDLLPVRIKDRQYLTSAPLQYRAEQSYATVYVCDDAKGTARLAAAFGEALHFDPMFQPEIIAAMKGKTPKLFKFLWSDTNGNGKVELAEVKLEEKKNNENVRLGRFDSELGCVDGNTLYTVKEFLPDGTPVYETRTMAASGLYRMSGNRVFTMNTDSPTAKGMENALYSPKGDRLWTYPVDHPSVSGLWLPPWSPGYVTNQFAIIGHETAPAGDLGEYLVIHANNGQWNLWTADGFFAGHIMYHTLDRRSHNFGLPTGARGTRLDPLTTGQEHFHGQFVQSEKDGRTFAVAGHNFMGLIEVKGMEKFKRTRGEIKVTPEDIQRVRTWESDHARREILSTVPVIEARRAATIPRIDGVRGENEWPEATSKLDDESFTMTYDGNNVYFCFFGSGIKLLKNSGTDFQRTFKTGAALDVQIATDPKADPVRQMPAAGDVRLLFTFSQDKPRIVLYQPVAPGAKPDEAWETFTAVAGKSHFDRVVLLDKAQLAMKEDSYGNLFIEASVPLKDIGLKITPDLRLKMDWGMIISRDGNQAHIRSYWTNKMANGTSDESFESRLEPHLWGYVQFPGGAVTKKNTPGLDGDEKKGGDILDILER
jgi:hypothetical protein